MSLTNPVFASLSKEDLISLLNEYENLNAAIELLLDCPICSSSVKESPYLPLVIKSQKKLDKLLSDFVAQNK
jgi:hypothetical protein